MKNDEIGHSEFRLSDQKFSMEESHRLPLKGVTRLPYDPIEGKYIVEVGTLNIKVELLEPVQRNCIKKFYVDLENDRNRPDSNRINREAGEERSTDENDFDEGLVQPFESNKNMITELHVDLENDRNRPESNRINRESEAGDERSTDENDFDEGLEQPFESNQNMIIELHVDLENDQNRPESNRINRELEAGDTYSTDENVICIIKFHVDLENYQNRPESNRINRESEAGDERSTDENDFDEGLEQPFESNKNMITQLHVDFKNDRNGPESNQSRIGSR
ncbi:hypothetical protein QYM36_008685 [Artemia franciscana]|uniref:Uncharacterized protein n=1 Tax=Artemia franciscana TaxID=6661 RepID=A0AA88I2M7_ARTSF|nr:hypothetical protein QYM36_008685 [Artemia franciscana]